jgi:hypothetical protein
MLQNILKSGGAQKLSRAAQKNITGGIKIPTTNCRCFCVNNAGVKITSPCLALCPNGSFPGLYPGTPVNCTYIG